MLPYERCATKHSILFICRMLPIQTVPSRGLPFLVSSRPDIIAVSHLQTDDPFYAPSMFNAREISLLLPLRNLYFGGHLRLRKRHLLILPLVLDVLSHHAQILFRGGLEDPTTLIALDELECATLCIVEPRIRPDQVLCKSQSSGNNFFRELKIPAWESLQKDSPNRIRRG